MGYGLHNNIVKSVSDGTAITANGVETLSASYLIPANTVKVGDILTLWAQIKRTVTTAVTWNAKVYFNTSASLSGATIVATANASTAQNFICMGRIFVIKAANITQGFQPSTYTDVDRYDDTLTFNEANIDWTVNQYLIISLTNDGASNSSVVSGCLLLKD